MVTVGEATLERLLDRRRRLLAALGLAALAALSACAPTAPTATATAAPTPSQGGAPTAIATVVPTPPREGTPTAAPTEPSRGTPAPPPTVVATPTGLPSPTTVPAPTITAPAATPSPTGVGQGNELPYLDDRSGPEALLRSYVSALDRREYLRAYSYWESGAATSDLPPFPEFAKGFADTASVRLTLGEVGGDAGAGQLYFAVPLELRVVRTGGAAAAFVGCYRLHLARPELQAVPPFRPLAIAGATVTTLPPGADAAARLTGACGDQKHPPPSLGETPADPADIGPARYLDDRTNAEQVLRSYYNAVNRKEYARAYGYWEPSATGAIPPFDTFARGYADTASAQLGTGPVTGDAAAGNLYYTLPVALVARTADGAARTFAGCYTLHLAQPGVQAQPPFRPLGIRSAAIQPTASAAEADARLKAGCPPSS